MFNQVNTLNYLIDSSCIIKLMLINVVINFEHLNLNTHYLLISIFYVLLSFLNLNKFLLFYIKKKLNLIFIFIFLILIF
jgi:hypothetical protein